MVYAVVITMKTAEMAIFFVILKFYRRIRSCLTLSWNIRVASGRPQLFDYSTLFDSEKNYTTLIIFTVDLDNIVVAGTTTAWKCSPRSTCWTVAAWKWPRDTRRRFVWKTISARTVPGRHSRAPTTVTRAYRSTVRIFTGTTSTVSGLTWPTWTRGCTHSR